MAGLNKPVTVETCTPRRGKGYLITYRVKGQKQPAYSDRQLEEGQSVFVRDGVVS